MGWVNCPRCGLIVAELMPGQTERDPTLAACVPPIGDYFALVKWAAAHNISLRYTFRAV